MAGLGELGDLGRTDSAYSKGQKRIEATDRDSARIRSIIFIFNWEFPDPTGIEGAQIGYELTDEF